MSRKLVVFLYVFGLLFTQGASGLAQGKDMSAEVIKELKQEIQKLRAQMEAEKRAYEERLNKMQEKIDAVSRQMMEKAATGAEEDLEAEIAKEVARATPAEAKGGLWSSLGRGVQSLNPDISVIIDANYYNDDTDDGIEELMEGIAGFSAGHGHEHGHEHGGFEEGFNLREVELYLSAEVDPYFKAYTTLAFHEEGSEVEEAVFQTTSLPAGFQVLGGKFLSHLGRINSQHPHEWDFVDRPLVYELTLGDHGLLEKGAQLSWLAPTPFHLLLGVEALQGENEKMFNYIGGEHLPDHKGPRAWVGWIKCSPNLPQKHGLQVGIFGGTGSDQEAHGAEEAQEHGHEGENGEEQEHEEAEAPHYLDGDSYFCGADVVYKYDSRRQHGHGDFTVQGEYFRRKKDLEMEEFEAHPGLVGRDREDEQDGYYIQGLYGFLPRWRLGLRWGQVGLVNEIVFPDGTSEDFDNSDRLSAMVDFTPTEFSRLRFQSSWGDYELADGSSEDVWQVFFQVLVSLGTHGAHKF